MFPGGQEVYFLLKTYFDEVFFHARSFTCLFTTPFVQLWDLFTYYTLFIPHSCSQNWNFPHHTVSKAKLESRQNVFTTRIKISTAPSAKVTTDADTALLLAFPKMGTIVRSQQAGSGTVADAASQLKCESTNSTASLC